MQINPPNHANNRVTSRLSRLIVFSTRQAPGQSRLWNLSFSANFPLVCARVPLGSCSCEVAPHFHQGEQGISLECARGGGKQKREKQGVVSNKIVGHLTKGCMRSV